MGSEGRQARRGQIGERIAAIRTRVGELQQAQQTGRHPVSSGGQLAAAQQHAAVSEAAAQRALAACIAAFQRAAEAHERLATQYEQAAALGGSGQAGHRQRAAFHRTAAAADRQRGEQAQSLLSSRAGEGHEAG